MKDAMQILDFDDPSSEPLKTVLLQCYVTPIFLKADQVVSIIIAIYNLKDNAAVILGKEIFKFIVLLVIIVHC